MNVFKDEMINNYFRLSKIMTRNKRELLTKLYEDDSNAILIDIDRFRDDLFTMEKKL